MAVLLVGMHRTAEGEHRVVVRDLARRARPSLGEPPLLELDAALPHLIREHAGTGVRLVDDGEGAHRWDTGETRGGLAWTHPKAPREPSKPRARPAPIGPYSQGLVADGVLYCSGQVPLDPATEDLVEGGIAEQAQRCLESLDASAGRPARGSQKRGADRHLPDGHVPVPRR